MRHVLVARLCRAVCFLAVATAASTAFSLPPSCRSCFRTRGCDCCDDCNSPRSMIPGPTAPESPPPDTATATDDMGEGAGDLAPNAAEPELNFASESSAFAGQSFASNSSVGYIDTAWVRTQLRFRYDAAYGFKNADRAEFFYTTWTTFGGKAPPNLVGPQNNVNSQTFALYYEQRVAERLSGFIEAPILLNDPSGVPGPGGSNEQGFGDLIAGVKFALIDDCDRKFTFQLKNYIPTGDPDRWLTAGHYSLEPGLLYFQQLNERWMLESELRDWIPIGGAVNPLNNENYAGNVLRYGIGLSYLLDTGGCYQIRPVVEAVGWSVLDGQKFAFGTNPGPVDAAGDTIVNLKVGVRIGAYDGGSIYAGYGRCLTGEQWYQDIFRFEYRRMF